MQFACEKCGTRYAVPDEKVRGKRIRTKCRKCGSDIIVEGPPGQPGVAPRSTGSVVAAMKVGMSASQPSSRPAATAPTPAKTHKTEERWTVALSRTSRRRMTTAELVQGYENGKVTNSALVWKAGMEEWQSPFDIPALALALQARGFGRPAVVPSAEKEATRIDPLPIPTTTAEDWDEEAATRVVDSSLRFPGRPSRPAGERSDPAPARLPPPAPLPPVPPAPEPVKVEPHWRDEDDEETTALPPVLPASVEQTAEGGVESVARASKPKPFDFEDEATAVIAPDRARELLAEESEKNITLPPPPGPTPPEEEEATQVFEADRARALLGATGGGGPARESARPRQPERLPRQPPRIPARRPPAPPAEAPMPPAEVPAETPVAAETTPSRQPPRPRAPSLSDAETAPLPTAQKKGPETPKPAAGTPPLASLAPPKPSTFPPPPRIAVSPPPPEPPRPEEPSVVVAEVKPPRMIEAALRTLPAQRRPTAPVLRTMQNEPTRVVRVVKKGPGLAFWIVLIVALLAAAAGGFVVSQMLRDHHAPSWFRRS